MLNFMGLCKEEFHVTTFVAILTTLRSDRAQIHSHENAVIIFDKNMKIRNQHFICKLMCWGGRADEQILE